MSWPMLSAGPQMKSSLSGSKALAARCGVVEQQSSITAHLVNLSNPMMMKGSFREILPVGPQKVRVKLPDGAKARGVKFLVSEAKAQWRQSGAWVETTTPPIGLHEVVAVDL